MDNKNNKISTNYKDYKYVYTGHDDYMKKHHLDKKEIKEEKEQIIHDHRNVFDFNNPNQHTHDYSFDFSQESKPNQYKDKYGNVYNQKPIINTNYNNQTTTQTYTKTTSTTYNRQNINTLNDKTAIRTIKFVIFMFFIMPFLIIFLPAIIELFTAFDDQNYVVNQEPEITYINNHQDIAETLCTSITERNFNLIINHIMPYEKEIINFQKWKTIIDNYDNEQLNENYQITCVLSAPHSLTINQLEQLEYEYKTNYDSPYTTIEDGYYYQIIIKGNTFQTYIIEVIKIDDVWYLYSIN